MKEIFKMSTLKYAIKSYHDRFLQACYGPDNAWACNGSVMALLIGKIMYLLWGPYYEPQQACYMSVLNMLIFHGTRTCPL